MSTQPIVVPPKKRLSTSRSTLLSSLPPIDGDIIDRITVLPEYIRLHLLTFLSLKSAIRTGTLSTQWKDLWKFRYPHTDGGSRQISSNLVIDRPDSLLVPIRLLQTLKPDTPLNSIHLTFPYTSSQSLLHNFLILAADRTPEDLSLDLHTINSRLRHSVSICAQFPRLARLALSGFHLVSGPTDFGHMSFLEVLKLHHIIDMHDDMLTRIVTDCPMIRTVDLRFCPDLHKIRFPAAPFLSAVTVVGCTRVAEVTIEATNLKRFHYCGEMLVEYKLGGIANLEDIYVNCFEPGNSPIRRDQWVESFGGLILVKYLTLSSLALEGMVIALKRKDIMERIYAFLIELQLIMVTWDHFSLVRIFLLFKLCHFCKLEKLFIELPALGSNSPCTSFMFQAVVLGNLPQLSTVTVGSLRTIRINNFKGHCYEMELVKFFLANAVDLKSLVLVIPTSDNNEERHSDVGPSILSKLSSMPKLSEEVEIVVVDKGRGGTTSAGTHDQVYSIRKLSEEVEMVVVDATSGDVTGTHQVYSKI